MDGLTPKQQLFATAYLTCLNATEAARRAGYKGNDVTLGAVGAENLKKPQIKKYIAEQQAIIAQKAEREVVDVYEEFYQQLDFAKELRERAKPLIHSDDANDRKFAIEAVKVCDMAIDKFAKLGGDYTKEKENPADLKSVARTITEFRQRIATDAEIYAATNGKYGHPMPDDSFVEAEIGKLLKTHKVLPEQLATEMGKIG